MKTIHYSVGYKYRVERTFTVYLEDFPATNLDEPIQIKGFVEIGPAISGGYYLKILFGYAWDGATCALDTKNFRRGSAVHDALLQLIGLGLLQPDPFKLYADKFLIVLCKQDKMWWLRRCWVYLAVRVLGDPQGSEPKQIFSAP